MPESGPFGSVRGCPATGIPTVILGQFETSRARSQQVRLSPPFRHFGRALRTGEMCHGTEADIKKIAMTPSSSTASFTNDNDARKFFRTFIRDNLRANRELLLVHIASDSQSTSIQTKIAPAGARDKIARYLRTY